MSGHNFYCEMRDTGGRYLAAKRLLVVGANYSSIRADAKEAKTIIVEEPPDYTLALKDINAGRFSKDTIVVFDRSPSPDEALDKLDHTIRKVQVLFNFPDSIDEARAIHGPDMDDILQRYMNTFKNLSTQLADIDGLRIDPKGGKRAAEWVSEYISNTKEDELVLILSHVEPDRTFIENTEGDQVGYLDGRLPLIDKSAYKLSQHPQSKSLVWTLGCDTWDVLSEGVVGLNRNPTLAISRPLEYQESVTLAKQIAESDPILRNKVRRIQSIKFPRLPPNVPKAPDGTLQHFNLERPHKTLAILVENIPGPNIVTIQLTEIG